MNDAPTRVVVVAGPTASGKSALALALAERFGGVVINADSMQVYRELTVLTARPRADALARAPHRLYGIVPASEACSAGRWRELARDEIAAARGTGRTPIVAGGTGLYLRALMAGLARIPPVPDSVRRRVRVRIAREGAPALHAELAARDPASAARLVPNDAQRIARALEVLEATGRGLADWQLAGQGADANGLIFFVILVAPARAQLHRAIEHRFVRMVADGALAEVRALAALGLDPGLPAMKAVGVRELSRHLAGEATLDEACAEAVAATRRYAKRQVTWFRHQLVPDLAIETLPPPVPEDLVFPAVARFIGPR
jgi:tRNA dimethylallyltransferase